MAADRDYCDWLAGQDWLAQRFPALHTIIINNFAEPEDTPEHNALQLRFLPESLRLKLTLLALHCLRPGVQHLNFLGFHPVRYAPLIAACGQPRFEQNAIDVWWDVGLWVPYAREGHDPASAAWEVLELSVLVECKPSLGDDYPAVLRFMHSLTRPKGQSEISLRAGGIDRIAKVVIVEQYSFRGGTVEQVQSLFQSSGVLLFSLAEIERVPPVTCMPQDDLPDAAYCGERDQTHGGWWGRA